MRQSSLLAAPQAVAVERHGEGDRWFACLIVGPGNDGVDARREEQDGNLLEDGWLAACRDLTPAVERLSSQRALLDLGTCSPADAQTALLALVRRVAQGDKRVRAGIAPGLILAELAALMATSGRPLLMLTSDALLTFLRRVPVSALQQLAVAGPDRVTPEIVERLERYGLRTLGDLARLSEPAIRRQFGAAGEFLAAVAAGRDERPLQHTPAPVEWRVRLRLGSAVTPERALAALEPFAAWAATRLRCEGRQTRRLRVRLRWECGCAQSARLSLRQHTHDTPLLAQELTRLLAPLLAAHRERVAGDASHMQALAGIWIALGDFAPVLPSQRTFWHTREQHLAAARCVANTLARRHGRPLLLRTELAHPAAIYDEERHQLAALPAAAPARSSERQRRRNVARLNDTTGDPWRTVPQRLHWW